MDTGKHSTSILVREAFSFECRWTDGGWRSDTTEQSGSGGTAAGCAQPEVSNRGSGQLNGSAVA